MKTTHSLLVIVIKMVHTSYLEPFANNLLLLTNILSTVRINKLLVPEVIANDCLDAVLDCTYSGATDDVTVLWLLNGAVVYEWTHGAEPKLSGVLDGHVNQINTLTSSVSNNSTMRSRALRIVDLTPELSGDYTCIVRSRGQEARETKSMTVFSPERDFELTFSSLLVPDVVHIRCLAKRLHPQPDLIIEYDKFPVAQQQQRIWRNGAYYDTECVAFLPRVKLQANAEVACRLQLPQVDYTAITKKYLNFDNHGSGATVLGYSTLTCVVVLFSFFNGIGY